MPKNMIVRLGVDASDFKKKMEQAGVAAENAGKRIKKNMSMSELGSEVSNIMGWGGSPSGIMGTVNAGNAAAARSQLKMLTSYRNMLADAGFDDYQFGLVSERIKVLEYELNAYEKTLQRTADAEREAAAEAEKLGSKSQKAEVPISKTSRELQQMAGSGRKISIVPGFLNRIRDSAESSNGRLEKMVRTIRNVSIVSFGLRIVRGIFGELGTIVRQYVSENAALQAQVNSLKSSFGQALAPAINIVTNALSALMPYVVGVSNAIGSLISNLFGSGWTTVAADANAAAKAIGGAGGAQKEFNRQLAGFDEITKLTKDSGGGGGAASITTPIAGKTPAWLTSLSQQIKEAAQSGDFFGVGAALANAVNAGIKKINLSDSSLGEKVAALINGGIAGATGFVQTMDWRGLGTTIKEKVSGIVSGIDWAGAFSLAGSVAGGLAALLDGLFGNAVAAISRHFQESIAEAEDMGLDIMAGIGIGIGKALANIGKWIKENVLTPFLDGFRDTFDIHSPSRNKDILSIGKNIMLGIFNGLLEPLKDPVGWIKRNIFAPLSQGFADVFGEDSGLAKAVSKFFFGDESFGQNLEVDVTANVTKIEDHAPEKIIKNGKLLVNILQDNARNKTFGNGVLQVTTVTDQATNKTFGNGILQVTTVTDQTTNKTFGNGILQISSLSDNIKEKVLSGGLLSVNSWRNNIAEKDKKLSLSATVNRGWTGTLESYLGISSVTTTLNLKTPKIKVTWGTSKANPLDPNSASTPVPTYTAWFAKGAILRGAQIFGRIGNTRLGGGEAGREAVLPLDSPHDTWMDDIADRVAARLGGAQNVPETITVNVSLDGKVLASTVVRIVNAQARATGTNPLAAYL